MSELIDLTLPPADLAAIQTLLTSLEDAMPFLVGLSADRVKALFKLGPRSEAFVMKALEAAELHPDLLPRSSPLPAMQRDAALRETLRPIRTRVATLLELLDGTMMLAGADLMKNASAVYRLLRIHSKGEGIDDLLEDMGKRFAKRSKPTPAAPTPSEETPPEPLVEPHIPTATSHHSGTSAGRRPVTRRQPGNVWFQPSPSDANTGVAGSEACRLPGTTAPATQDEATLEQGVSKAGAPETRLLPGGRQTAAD